MTTYYWSSWSNNTSGDQDKTETHTLELWERLTEKKNWRIVQLANGYFQTEFQNVDQRYGPLDEWKPITRRETLEGAEAAIDGSIKHYEKKLEFAKGPKVVKTFE